MSDPSRTETLTAEEVKSLREMGERAGPATQSLSGTFVHAWQYLELCDTAIALRAELTRLQDAHRAQEERIKGLEQENATLLVELKRNTESNRLKNITIDGVIARAKHAEHRAEQAEAREQATRAALANAIDIIDEIESMGMIILLPKAQAEVAEMRKLLPAAGAAAARKETT